MLALLGGTAYTMGPRGIIEGERILLSEGRVTAVGSGFALPSRAQRIDCRGKVILPGLIDCHTHLGIHELGVGIEGKDYNELEDPVTPELRAIDAVNPADEAFKDALAAGITAVMTAPGSIGVIGGQIAALKTHGKILGRMVLRAPAGMKAALGENPMRFFGREQDKMPLTRMACAALIRETLVRAQNYLKKKRGKGEPDHNLQDEILALVLEQVLPLRIHAHRADDILTALRIGREFGLTPVIDHCTEGHLVADALAAAGSRAVVGPTMSAKSKVELAGKVLKTPAVLGREGVCVALTTDHPITPIQNLRIVAALAVKAGMPRDAALRAITLNPAAILGIDDRVGSLEEGKDGDLVIFNGDPLDPMTPVQDVYIGEKKVYSSRR